MRQTISLSLFPLNTVLFPQGWLPLKIFEQRYIDLTKDCLKDQRPFGICRIVEGPEVATPGSETPKFADVGTLAHIREWDMPTLGIFHIKVKGGQRFQVRSHEVHANGLIVAEVSLIANEPVVPISGELQAAADLLEVLIERIGAEHFSETRAFDDASWVSHRLAEILPLKPSIKQSMLEVNDAELRLKLIIEYMRKQGILK